MGEPHRWEGVFVKNGYKISLTAVVSNHTLPDHAVPIPTTTRLGGACLSESIESN